ncbi:uncharacterized protein LOC128551858, partial [Mercenaria mercenaria]|uniref:uncharacterized protein LOC128551858 n=1 Tax=Mercenaria mercenaria TaxID=6596 RepID=UPI00234E79AD
MADRVVLFGHSFVRRFNSFIQSNPEHLNIGLSALQFDVNCYGFGGLSLMQRSRLHCVDNKMKGTDLVILDIGSNDLADPLYEPEKFAKDLLSYAGLLIEGLGVKRVVVMQVLPRKSVPFPGYNDNVILANSKLKTEISDSHLPIVFWKHRGMWNPDVCIFSPDGVHLSNETGYPK